MAFSRVAESTDPSCHLMLVESPTLESAAIGGSGTQSGVQGSGFRMEG
jgi:hypothetical protein